MAKKNGAGQPWPEGSENSQSTHLLCSGDKCVTSTHAVVIRVIQAHAYLGIKKVLIKKGSFS